MSQILEGLDGVECNIGDVLFHGTTQEELDRRLEAVLQRLSNANVTLIADKCVFNVSSVQFLGQIVGPDGIKPDPAKVRAVLEMPTPTNQHEVRSFLGMVNQFSKFTTNLTDMTKPIQELLVKNTVWRWGPPQQDAFDKIKKALTSTPILPYMTPKSDKNSSRCIIIWPWSSGATRRRNQASGNQYVHLTIDDSNRGKVCPNRERGSSSNVGM